MIYLYLNNYALCNGRKNIPRTLLFIVNINLYYGCDGHLKIKYKSIKHKQICTIHVIILHKCLIVFFSCCNALTYLLVIIKRQNFRRIFFCHRLGLFSAFPRPARSRTLASFHGYGKNAEIRSGEENRMKYGVPYVKMLERKKRWDGLNSF